MKFIKLLIANSGEVGKSTYKLVNLEKIVTIEADANNSDQSILKDELYNIIAVAHPFDVLSSALIKLAGDIGTVDTDGLGNQL